MPIGKPAPDFKGTAVMPDMEIAEMNLETSRAGGGAVFYPLDFTFVCPRENHGFKRLRQVQSCGCGSNGYSIHSHFSQ